MAENYFKQLYDIDVSDKVEKKNGLSYLSWAFAWAEVKKLYPDAQYEIKKFGDNHLPYIYDALTGYMVYTTVTIEGVCHEMWLPVMDGANKAMKAEAYTYKVGRGEKAFEKTVDAADMFDINKTLMRCLVKNLAMHGLGLYIYAGEDLPEATIEEAALAAEAEKEAQAALRKAKDAVIAKGTLLIKAGVTKDDMMDVVSKHNDGNKNPSSIKNIEVANTIIKAFDELMPPPTEVTPEDTAKEKKTSKK